MLSRNIEKEVIPVSEKYGISQVVYSPLGQGMLTGKYKSGNIPQDSRAANDDINSSVANYFNEANFAKVEKLAAIAKEVDTTLPALALAWVLRQPNVASALVGASRPEQIEANVNGAKLDLSAEIVEKIDEILA